MFGDGSWGVALVLTPSAGNESINRIAFAYVLVMEYCCKALLDIIHGKSVAFVMFNCQRIGP